MRTSILFLAIMLRATVAFGQTPKSPAPAYHESQVEQPATLERNAPKPKFPPARKAAGIEGRVVVRFVVDTLGVVEATTLQTVTATDQEFAKAVEAVVPLFQFEPALRDGKRVRQYVQQSFVFAIPACETRKARPPGCLPPLER